MKSTDIVRVSAPAPSVIDDGFEELRGRFYARLRADRVQLTSLSASLARVADDPGCIFEDLRLFAHRLRGAAAIFESSEVSNAACALELAASLAKFARAGKTDAATWMAIEKLVDLLASCSGRDPPFAVAASDRAHSDAKPGC